MRTSFAFLFTFVLAASASSILERQSVTGLPTCVRGCFLKVDNGGCGLDYSCLCRSQTFIDALAQCVYDECPADLVDGAVTSARQLCLTEESVSINVPEPSGEASGAPSGSAPAPTTTKPTSNTPSASTPASSPSPSASGAGNGSVKHGAQAVAGAIAAGLVVALI